MLAAVAAPVFHTLSRGQIEDIVAERHKQEAPNVMKKNSKDPTINLMIPHKNGTNYMVKCPGCNTILPLTRAIPHICRIQNQGVSVRTVNGNYHPSRP